MRRNLSIYLLAMAWWVFVYLAVVLIGYPPIRYFSSYVPSLVALAVFGFSALLLGIGDARYGIGKRLGHWGRFFIVFGVYTLGSAIGLAVTTLLDVKGYVGYFGGDPEGALPMLYLPAIVFYLIAGSLLCTAIALIKRVRDKRQEPEETGGAPQMPPER